MLCGDVYLDNVKQEQVSGVKLQWSWMHHLISRAHRASITLDPMHAHNRLMENVQQLWTIWLLYKHRAQFTYKHTHKLLEQQQFITMNSRRSPEKKKKKKWGEREKVQKAILQMKICFKRKDMQQEMTPDRCVTRVLKKRTEIHDVDRRTDGQVVTHI